MTSTLSEGFTNPSGKLDEASVADAYRRALHERHLGHGRRACELWGAIEVAAREAGEHWTAVQACAERSFTLTLWGHIGAASFLCEAALADLASIEDADWRASVWGVPDEWGVGRTTVRVLRRLRAEQRRRAGDYAGAHRDLAAIGDDRGDERPEIDELWSRVILSHAVRLAGDLDGALEIAQLAREAAPDPSGRPHAGLASADRAIAQARLARGELDEALGGFSRLTTDAAGQAKIGLLACHLGIGEVLRRKGHLRQAEQHLVRTRDAAFEYGHMLHWTHAQLCLAEIARSDGRPRAEVAMILDGVRVQRILLEQPWLAVRTTLLAALSAPPGTAERLLDTAECQLGRFQRRSCDSELDRGLIERCRTQLAAGEPVGPIPMDFV
jgi:tetratricopeptide (TPR) repeat protein